MRLFIRYMYNDIYQQPNFCEMRDQKIIETKINDKVAPNSELTLCIF